MDYSRGDFIVSEEKYWPCPDCDNQPELIREEDLYSLRCTGCSRRTADYATIAEAELAWIHDIRQEFPDIFAAPDTEIVIRSFSFR